MIQVFGEKDDIIDALIEMTKYYIEDENLYSNISNIQDAIIEVLNKFPGIQAIRQ